jgi:hypothetical protein
MLETTATFWLGAPGPEPGEGEGDGEGEGMGDGRTLPVPLLAAPPAEDWPDATDPDDVEADDAPVPELETAVLVDEPPGADPLTLPVVAPPPGAPVDPVDPDSTWRPPPFWLPFRLSVARATIEATAKPAVANMAAARKTFFLGLALLPRTTGLIRWTAFPLLQRPQLIPLNHTAIRSVGESRTRWHRTRMPEATAPG